MKTNNYNLVNWQESMKVGHSHLQQTENYFIERLGDNLATRLTGYNFGLLPSPDPNEYSSEFDISEEITGKVEIRLKSCNAITAGGYRIAYNPAHSEYLLSTYSFDEQEKEQKNKDSLYWDVILTVNPFERIPSGMPDEQENPPRHPYAIEQYKLSIAPQRNINYEQLGKYHLVIGRIRKSGNRYEVDSDYIPACTSMCSHPSLEKYYKEFGTCLSEMERASKVILSKIRNRSQNAPLAYNIAGLCENLMRYIATVYFRYRNTGRDMPPIDVVDCFSTLAHTCFASLSFIGKAEREELMKYFYEWSDVTPGSFSEMLSNTMDIIYDHNNIRAVMIQLQSFLRTLSELWIRLSTLEYIGQHKENIVISERSYQQETKKKETGGWTILD